MFKNGNKISLIAKAIKKRKESVDLAFSYYKISKYLIISTWKIFFV